MKTEKKGGGGWKADRRGLGRSAIFQQARHTTWSLITHKALCNPSHRLGCIIRLNKTWPSLSFTPFPCPAATNICSWLWHFRLPLLSHWPTCTCNRYSNYLESWVIVIFQTCITSSQLLICGDLLLFSVLCGGKLSMIEFWTVGWKKQDIYRWMMDIFYNFLTFYRRNIIKTILMQISATTTIKWMNFVCGVAFRNDTTTSVYRKKSQLLHIIYRPLDYWITGTSYFQRNSSHLNIWQCSTDYLKSNRDTFSKVSQVKIFLLTVFWKCSWYFVC